MENTQTASKSPKLKLDFKDSKYATGRRKTSIAKVWLKKGLDPVLIQFALFSIFISYLIDLSTNSFRYLEFEDETKDK